MIAVPTTRMQDEAVYENAQRFDPYRFVKMREQAGSENKFQFTTSTPDMYAFGHGLHVCPGRFFASNEIKVSLVHLLIKFDWKFEGEKQGKGGRPKRVVKVDLFLPNPTAKLTYKRRTSEIDI